MGDINFLVGNAGIGMRTVNPRFLSEPQPFWQVAPAGFRDVVETKLQARSWSRARSRRGCSMPEADGS